MTFVCRYNLGTTNYTRSHPILNCELTSIHRKKKKTTEFGLPRTVHDAKGEDYENLTPHLLRKTRSRALDWIQELRNEDQPSRKWGSDVGRIAVALYLSNDSYFRENRTIRDEISYELNLDLLSRLAL
ncbi:hypothetical protein AVEN_45854-1 [Araneus ventricosus]|uniref:Uncharacterized protein n=1 Tax=Araneus ventricosus TaxID=182803 RepID=A0A4Y2JSQ3_ARAVE|nr:hypothetical protein AVEN_45854-1 [Araneus ventricosus]